MASGTDSAFYAVEKRLNEPGLVRRPWETLAGWIKRVEHIRPPVLSTEGLSPILNLHYRLRFDPRGITEEEEAALESGVQAWLKNNGDEARV